MTRFCSQALVRLGIITQRLRNLQVQSYRLHLFFSRLNYLSILFRPHKDTLADSTFQSDEVNHCVPRYGYIFHWALPLPKPNMPTSSMPMVEAMGTAPMSSITSNIYNTIYYTTLLIECKPIN